MTLKDAQIIRNLQSAVDSLQRQVADLTRRVDDWAKNERKKQDKAA
jgi:hypothetical protein